MPERRLRFDSTLKKFQTIGMRRLNRLERTNPSENASAAGTTNASTMTCCRGKHSFRFLIKF